MQTLWISCQPSQPISFGASVDLIITGGTPALRAAKQATSEIPIVFSVGVDPVKRGLVASMSRPGGNLTGFAFGLYEEKQLQVLKAAVPAISRVAYPVFPENTAPSLEYRDDARSYKSSTLQSRVGTILRLSSSLQSRRVLTPHSFRMLPDWVLM